MAGTAAQKESLQAEDAEAPPRSPLPLALRVEELLAEAVLRLHQVPARRVVLLVRAQLVAGQLDARRLVEVVALEGALQLCDSHRLLGGQALVAEAAPLELEPRDHLVHALAAVRVDFSPQGGVKAVEDHRVGFVPGSHLRASVSGCLFTFADVEEMF